MKADDLTLTPELAKLTRQVKLICVAYIADFANLIKCVVTCSSPWCLTPSSDTSSCSSLLPSLGYVHTRLQLRVALHKEEGVAYLAR